jgi:hypothetical protein
MPAADFALIGALKTSAKRAGLNVKKSELLRLGLHALQAKPSGELRELVMALRKLEGPKQA